MEQIIKHKQNCNLWDFRVEFSTCVITVYTSCTIYIYIYIQFPSLNETKVMK
jgi:hypothetical protein